MMQEIFSFLDSILNSESKIVLAVSGWADSMFTAFLIKRFWIEKRWDAGNLFWVHCNHVIRDISVQEEEMVVRFLVDIGKLFLRRRIKGETWESERELRLRRYAQFSQVCEEVNADFLVLGHHLTDRVETTFLNLLRGAGLAGFVWMKYCDDHHLLETTKVLRPLLSVTKSQIYKFCKKYNVTYSEDVTNIDSEISKRNKLRNDILPQLYELSHAFSDEKNTFLESMQNVYTDLETNKKCTKEKSWKNISWETVLQERNSSEYRDAEYIYQVWVNQSEISENILIEILKKLEIYWWVSRVFIQELTSFLNKNTSGYKYRKDVYFFVSHGDIFIIKAPKDFWKKYIGEQKITESGTILRYPQKGDHHKGKTRNQRCLNQKIPVFWRNFVQVEINEGKIVNIFLTV